MLKLVPLSLLLLLTMLFTGASAATPVLGVKGIEIDAGKAGTFLLGYPKLTRDGKHVAASDKTLGDGSALLKYEGGAELRIDLRDNGVFQLSFTKLPANATGVRIDMTLGGTVRGHHLWSANDSKPEIIPIEYAGKAFLFKGDAKRFVITHPDGGGFAIVQPHGFQQLQDNREWKTNSCTWFTTAQLTKNDAGEARLVYAITAPDAPAPDLTPKQVSGPAPVATPKIDRYGQRAGKEYPQKITSDDQLRADAAAQQAQAEAFKPDPRLDAYGGLAGSGEEHGLKKTGFFTLGQVNNRHVLVTPEGNVFFQLGMCGIARTDDDTLVKGREAIYEWLPPKTGAMASAWRDNPNSGMASFYVANWVRKFDKPFELEAWTGQVTQRLKQWGFNSAGAFSRQTEAMRAASLPYVSFLPLGGEGVTTLPDKIGAAKILDPFAPGIEEVLDAKFAKSVASKANDPLLIGYFLGNEQHVEMLPKLIPGYPGSKVPAKAKLVQILKEKYQTISAFNEAWKPDSPFADFEALNDAKLLVRTDAANADVLAFYRLYLETYHSMVQRLFEKHDPNHLLIGSRWTPGTSNNRDAVEIGGKYVDVVSINYYCYGIEKAFLDKVYEWSGGKPMIFSEWHYCSTERGLQGRMEVKDDRERGLAYRNYVEQSAALPYVVGHQWFIYTDQAITGRFFEGFNGEGNNTGFVDVADRPYPELTAAATETNRRVYDVMLGKTAPFKYEDPRFDGSKSKNSNKVVQVPRALEGFKLDGTTTNWPGRPAETIDSSRVVIGKVDPNLRADFRLCWDDQNLYVHVQVKDPTPMLNKRTGGGMWNSDAVELFLGARDRSQPGTLIFSDRQIIIGASASETGAPPVHVVDHPEESGQVRANIAKDVSNDGYTVQASIPWKLLGIEPKNETELLFDLAIDNSNDGINRVNQLIWNASNAASGDRALWGRAKLSEN